MSTPPRELVEHGGKAVKWVRRQLVCRRYVVALGCGRCLQPSDDDDEPLADGCRLAVGGTTVYVLQYRTADASGEWWIEVLSLLPSGEEHGQRRNRSSCWW